MNWDIDTEEGLANAVAWQQEFVKWMKDGGTWMIPRSMTLLRFDTTNKVVTVLLEAFPDDAVEKVFTAMGWTVERPGDKP